MDYKLLALIAITATLFVSLENKTNNLTSFEDFKAIYNKQYANTEEEVYRLAIFMQNFAEIQDHNAKTSETYKMGVNQFTDLTTEEFKNIYIGSYKPSTQQTAFIHDDEESAAASVNWVTSGKTGKVKDQGACAASWAFSTTGSSESLKAIKDGTSGDFSEQQLIDCCNGQIGNCYNYGCNGGQMDDSFRYLAKTGFCTESSYPYKAKNDFSNCAANSCTKDSFTISSLSVVRRSTAALQSAVTKQPVSIAADATNWKSYSTGVFSNCSTDIGYAAVLVGYTSSYWLVQCSWGSSWGENGYIKLAPGNTCGIQDAASYPIA